MAKWLMFQLNKGSVDGVPIVKKDMMNECHRPQFALLLEKPEWSGYVSKPLFAATETRDAYCFGWYAGHTEVCIQVQFRNFHDTLKYSQYFQSVNVTSYSLTFLNFVSAFCTQHIC